MKVVHIESGLGNQMLSYCEYLALKQSNPTDEIYIENIIYDIPESNDVICQWNGYELNRIFDIDAPNIKNIFTQGQWESVIKEIHESEFWNKNWNYPVYFTKAFEKGNLYLENTRGNFEETSVINTESLKYRIKQSLLGYHLKRIYSGFFKDKVIKGSYDQNILFMKSDIDIFTGQRLSFKYKGNDIEKIDALIRESFKFPSLQDEKNIDMLSKIKNINSVAIHARRGDMLGANGYCYKYGYFKRAVKYIKKNVTNPTFIFFCDPGSVEWCKNNLNIFGLNPLIDDIWFVDWNSGKDSYKDMHIMSECKHNIITNSSFGWWEAYLNKNPNKITCSPDVRINTTHSF